MKNIFISILLLMILCLSACTSKIKEPYEEIDLQNFIRVTIIEISPKVYYSEGDTLHSNPYQIAQVKINFQYNDLINASTIDELSLNNGDIIDALIIDDNLKVLKGANEFISPSWIVETIMHDEEGTKLEFKGISFPGGEGSKALILTDENKEKKISFVFDGEYSFVFTVYNKRINGSGNELYDGCNTDQFTKWFLSVSKSYNKQIM